MEQEQQWDLEIKAKSNVFDIDFKEIWRYRDLLWIFVYREIAFFYKQTILGPLWFLIQPLLTTIMFVVVFGNIANIPTDGKPKILFYLSGVILWNYFADALNSTASTFKDNAAIYGKVYFPRVISPIAKVFSNLIKFFIQLILFFAIYFYLVFTGATTFEVNINILLMPILLIIMINLGLGMGMIISSMTTKYKDLIFLVTFGVQLLMYATPVIYSLQSLEGTPYYNFIAYNPLSPAIECFKNSLIGGSLSYGMLLYSLISSVVVLIVGFLIFNKTEKSFIDTI
jgi:lipopolysaccharide transport system permease protein